MKKILAALLILVSTSANAADGKMSFELPKGWVLDKKVVANQGIDGAIYPKEQEWKTAPAVIYLRLAPKVKNSTPLTIEDDLNGFKEINDKLNIKNEPGLYTQDNKLAFVRRLTDPANGSTSITAYIDSGDSVSIIAIDAKSKAAAEKAYPTFRNVVKSYLYVIGAKTTKVVAEGVNITETDATPAPAKVQIKPSGKRAELMEYRDYHKPAPAVVEEKAEVKQEAKPEQKPEPKKEAAPVVAPKAEPKVAKKVEKPAVAKEEIIEATEEEIKKDTSGEYEYEEVEE